MSRSLSRTSALAASSFVLVLALARPVVAADARTPVLAETPTFVHDTEDPHATTERGGKGETCALDVGAPTLRERFAEWWRQSRALNWLSRVVQSNETSPRRQAPPPSYHLRSPLLSGLIVQPPASCDIAADPKRTDRADKKSHVECAEKARCEPQQRSGPTI